MTYTMLAFFTALLSLGIDSVLKTHLKKRPLFWYFHGFVFVMTILTNGYLTARPIVLYGEPFYLGIRLGTIPIEDFFYGFGLITFNVVLFEFFLSRRLVK